MGSDASNWYAINVAVVALIISIIAVVFTALQWWEARKTRISNENALKAQAQVLEAQAKLNEKAADAAHRSAVAAEQTSLSTQHLARTGQRAWVCVRSVEIKTRTRNELPGLCDIHLYNAGKTPAIGMSCVVRWVVDASLKNLDYEPKAPISRGTIGPEGLVSLPFDFQLNEADDEAIRRGTKTLYLFGRSTYQDVFGEARETRWCFYYSGARDFRPTADYNDQT